MRIGFQKIPSACRGTNRQFGVHTRHWAVKPLIEASNHLSQAVSVVFCLCRHTPGQWRKIVISGLSTERHFNLVDRKGCLEGESSELSSQEERINDGHVGKP